MTGYERIMTAINRGQPDQLPILEFTINKKVVRAICPEAETQADFEEAMDFDAVCAIHNFAAVSEEADGTYVDEWGVRFSSSAEIIDHPIAGPIHTREDLERYRPPDPDVPHRLGALPELVRRFKNRRAIVFLQRASFMHSVYLRGFEDLLMDYYADPEFASDLMDVVLDANIRLARNAIRAGADIIVLADDYAGNDTTIFSPKVFEKFIGPRLKKMVEAIHEEGGKVIKHSDGNLWPILDMIIDTGVDGINPIEPVARMDIGEVKAKYGDRVCMSGNIDCGHLLSEASTDEVRAAVRLCIRKASPGGGHIISSSNSVHSAVKPENYVAMIEAVREYGRYPLDMKALEG